MRKFIALCLAIFILTLCACSDKNKVSKVDTDSDTESVIEIITDTDSKNSNSTSSSTTTTSTSSSTATQTTNTTSGNAPTATNKKTPKTASNEYLTITTSDAIDKKGEITVTISSSGIANLKDVYGMQFSVTFKNMTLKSISDQNVPNGWNCTVPSISDANRFGDATFLLDCNFSTPLDNRQIVTLTFISDGSGASLSLINNDIITGNSNFTEYNGSNINM